MNDQQSFEFSAALPTKDLAETKREEGIQKSSDHSGEEWLAMAKRFMFRYCCNNRLIFCDDVWRAGLPRPESPRAFGAVMRHALKKKWMAKTTRVRPSVQSNMSLRMEYMSLVFGEEKNE